MMDYQQHKTAVLAAIGGALPVTFGQVRERAGLTAEELPRGHLHQLAVDAGYKVESAPGPAASDDWVIYQ